MTLRGKGINLQVLTECICYLLFGYLLFHRAVFKLCDSKDEAVSLRHVCFNVFMGGVYRKVLTDTPVSGKDGPFFCFYYPDSAACLPSGRS